jgi:hypothetical protein
MRRSVVPAAASGVLLVSPSLLLLLKWRRGGACGISLGPPSNKTHIYQTLKPNPCPGTNERATGLYFIVNQLSCPRGPAFILASFPSLSLSTVLTTRNYHLVVRLSHNRALTPFGCPTNQHSTIMNSSTNSSYAKLPFSPGSDFGPRLPLYLCTLFASWLPPSSSTIKTTFIKPCIRYNGPRLPSFSSGLSFPGHILG